MFGEQIENRSMMPNRIKEVSRVRQHVLRMQAPAGQLGV